MSDPVVERCRRVREQLLQQYGGLEGLLRKLEAMDRARAEARRGVRGKPIDKTRASKKVRRSAEPAMRSGLRK